MSAAIMSADSTFAKDAETLMNAWCTWNLYGFSVKVSDSKFNDFLRKVHDIKNKLRTSMTESHFLVFENDLSLSFCLICSFLIQILYYF